MELKIASLDGIAVIVLNGRYDAYGAPGLEKALQKALDVCAAGGTKPRVVIDLAQVNFIDSTGLATLLRGMKRCRERGGDLYLCSLQQPVRIIVELTRLDKAFSIFATQEEALTRFTAPSQSTKGTSHHEAQQG